uniref:AlNc14C173G8044 protein n=1 Tax=Albugo laibachii Nc14 TaxID=890382 RepID=F0WNM3_9STRA|nr:AlNc14C173G8044 [Albugo laibachii Nc14]|eukprot:CCA22914.1 AlNc14C173G8044 [Albugo laibachii Nc14]
MVDRSTSHTRMGRKSPFGTQDNDTPEILHCEAVQKNYEWDCSTPPNTTVLAHALISIKETQPAGKKFLSGEHLSDVAEDVCFPDANQIRVSDAIPAVGTRVASKSE